ncbi:MAG: arsenosugar biosynthesis radical SAM protein ArsS [Spirochaetes bacterium]|nr:arsenosugar biosynthesis radical SAM protein ArsS [Spirochaetota bacterium]
MTNAEQQLTLLTNIEGVENFQDKLKSSKQHPLQASQVEIFQINVGKRCNLSCKHCHVEAGPNRVEMMTEATFNKCLEILKKTPEIHTIDITGGSPEMNPYLEGFITEASALGKRLIVRSNLIILMDLKYKKFIDIYVNNKVELVGSLPDYHRDRTDKQRGKDAFDQSIRVLQLLNSKGYGKQDSGLILDLVHNPVGAYCPGDQNALEYEYRNRLKKEYDIEFNTLFCLTNMPVGRYLKYLIDSDNYHDYLNELVSFYNPKAVENVMCKTTVSVSWDGKLYDCDFNQMLDLGMNDPDSVTLDDFDIEKLNNRNIVIHNHCYGCTAGSGSSCQGALD